MGYYLALFEDKELEHETFKEFHRKETLKKFTKIARLETFYTEISEDDYIRLKKLFKK